MKYVVIFLSIFLVACVSTAKKLNAVSVGMTKAQVIDALGVPDETSGANNVEYLVYELRKAPGAATQTACGVGGVYTLGLAYLIKGCRYSDNDYFVHLQDGKVIAYGRIGDLNVTQKAEEAAIKQPAGE